MDGKTEADGLEHLRNGVAQFQVPEVFFEHLRFLGVALATVDGPGAAGDGCEALALDGIEVPVHEVAVNLDVSTLRLEDRVRVGQVIFARDESCSRPGGHFGRQVEFFTAVLGVFGLFFPFFAHAVLGVFLISLNGRSNALNFDFLKSDDRLLVQNKNGLKRAFLCDCQKPLKFMLSPLNGFAVWMNTGPASLAFFAWYAKAAPQKKSPWPSSVLAAS